MDQLKIYNLKAAKEYFTPSQLKVVKKIIKNYFTKGLIFHSVENMEGFNYNVVKNQFIIFGSIVYNKERWRTEIFQSYNTIIALQVTMPNHSPITVLDNNDWDYSTTTGKYRNKFLNCDKDEILKNIADGSILLMDLNKK